MSKARTIESARTELANLLLERADRLRVYLVVFAVVTALSSIAVAVLFNTAPTAFFGAAGAWTLLAILVGGRVIKISGEASRYQADRISYLRAIIAAHEASSSNPAIPRQPRSRARSLPATADSIDTVQG